jgi:microcystin-dependent protein
LLYLMRFVLSIILIVTLLVMIFYGFDFKEDFEETIISYKCCGKGIRGQRGVIGPNGNQQGIQGITGAEGDQGIKGDKGNKGDKGLQGESGLRGIKGMQGEQGVTGSIGPVGKSAYDAAYDAAILENPSPEWANDTYDKDKRIDMWRESLKGDQGITGNASGVTGLVGFSAYNIAYNLEKQKSNDNRSDWFNSGDKDEWLTSLTGEMGIMGGEGGEGPLNIPIGIIVAFHTPSIKDPIPEGWAECNGQNGTPDLRGRFILGGGGSGSVNAVGDVGGVEKHTLTDTEQNTPHTHQDDKTVKLALSCKMNEEPTWKKHEKKTVSERFRSPIQKRGSVDEGKQACIAEDECKGYIRHIPGPVYRPVVTHPDFERWQSDVDSKLWDGYTSKLGCDSSACSNNLLPNDSYDYYSLQRASLESLHQDTTAKNTTFRNTDALNTYHYHRTRVGDPSTNYFRYKSSCPAGEREDGRRSYYPCGLWGLSTCTRRVCQKTKEIFTKCGSGGGGPCPRCYGNSCPLCSGDKCPPCIPGAPVANGGCPGRDCSGIDIATAPKKYNTTARISAAAVAHENMPPFYVLRYIMKV